MTGQSLGVNRKEFGLHPAPRSIYCSFWPSAHSPDPENKVREFQGKSAIAIGALYVGFVGWSLYGAILPVETYVFRMVHMAFIFALAFLVYPVRPNAGPLDDRGWT